MMGLVLFKYKEEIYNQDHNQLKQKKRNSTFIFSIKFQKLEELPNLSVHMILLALILTDTKVIHYFVGNE